MTSPSLELQGAIVTRLKAVSAVTNIAGERVYDHTPRNAAGEITAEYPFVGLGEGDELADDADCITGFDISLIIDCWSREPGMPEVKRLAEAVRAALHNYELPLTDNALAGIEHEQTRFLKDPDGLTSHAVLTFNALVEQP